ncbi:MAG: S-layer homology domain-containing protein, partial [Peptococcaceae bacterium]|nr:S-layer homology domain-containing protein [Peptococcaceae bacterium]
MKKRIGLITGVLALSLVSQAYALECTIDYDTKTNEITLEGTAKAPVFVTVLPEGGDESGILEGEAAAIMHYSWHGSTEFNETIVLDKDLPSGVYCVNVTSNELYIDSYESDDRLYGTVNDNLKQITEEIYHINYGDAVQVLSDLNSVKDDAEAFEEMIASGKTGNEMTPEDERVPYTELLSIDPVEFAEYGAYAARQIVGTKDGRDFASTDEVLDLLDEYRALYEAINSSDPAYVIVENAAAFDADVERFVENLDDASASKLNVLISEFSADGKRFSEELPQLSALAVVQAADRWQTIKEVVTDTYADVLNIDYDVKNRDDVFGQMMYYEYNRFSDISDNFDKADAKVNDTVHKPSSGGSGGTSSFGVPSFGAEQHGEKDESARINFSDVPDDFWGYDAIYTLAAKNVISGYPDNSFRPNNNVRRAEFVKMLCGAFGLNGGSALPFEDVNPDDWYYSSISAAYANGVVS